MNFPRVPGKKGFAYVLSISLLAIIIVVVFLTSQRYTYQDEQESIGTRVRAMDDFVKSLNDDLSRAAYIASFRTLIALEEEIASTGTFLEDAETSFKETMFYGTINGTDTPLLDNSSLEDYLSKVSYLAADFGFQVDIRVNNIYLNQTNPWVLDVITDANVYVTDSTGNAYWNFTNNYTSQVPLYNLRDPIYSVFTDNKLPNTIRVLNTTSLVSGSDTSNLDLHINDSYYLASDLAPSFLMRFENNNSPSPYGIESIVNLEELSAQDLDTYPSRVKVDYIYFNNIATNTTICNVQGIPSEYYFIITEDRDELYQIQNLTYNTTC